MGNELMRADNETSEGDRLVTAGLSYESETAYECGARETIILKLFIAMCTYL